MPARRVPDPPHRVADRMGKSSGWLVRVQGLAVALIASLPLTLAGHYLANVAVGTTERPLGVGAIWLVIFLVAGLAMMAAAIGSLLPDWHIIGGRIPVVVVLGGLATATFDWSHLVDSWTGYAMNGAGVGAVVAGLQVVYWTPRSRVVRIAPRGGERATEWLAATLALGGALAFVLPHKSTIDGVSESCSPGWFLVETSCFTPDTIWWPLPFAAMVAGLTLMAVLHHDPVSAPGSKKSSQR